MSQAAQKIESPELALTYAAVASVNGPALVVETPAGQMQARKAVSCLLAPEPRDQVLVSVDRFGRAYVLAVLARPDALAENRLSLTGPTRLSVTGGDLILSAENGIDLTSPAHLSLAAADLNVHAGRAEIGLVETDFTGNALRAHIARIRIVARSVDSFVNNWVQRMTSCFRYVREHDETQAASSRQLVEGTLTVQTGNSVHLAEGHVKIDAEQIHLG